MGELAAIRANAKVGSFVITMTFELLSVVVMLITFIFFRGGKKLQAIPGK